MKTQLVIMTAWSLWCPLSQTFTVAPSCRGVFLPLVMSVSLRAESRLDWDQVINLTSQVNRRWCFGSLAVALLPFTFLSHSLSGWIVVYHPTELHCWTLSSSFFFFSGWRGGGYVYVYCNLAFHFLRLTRGFHLVLHPQSFCSWTILLVVDKAACSPASWRASLTCWALTKGFFFSTQTPLCSLTRLTFKLVCVKKTNAGKFCWQLSCYFWNLASLVTVYFEKTVYLRWLFSLWHYGTLV